MWLWLGNSVPVWRLKKVSASGALSLREKHSGTKDFAKVTIVK